MITSTLNAILSSGIEAELGASAYVTCSHVGIERWLLPGDWSSQCGLERNLQAAIVVVLSYSTVLEHSISFPIVCIPTSDFSGSVPAVNRAIPGKRTKV